MDPETASKYAGLPLQISKTESEIVENYQKGQLSAMDTLSKEVRIASAKDKYRAGNREQAIRDIIGLMTEGEIKLEEYITGYEKPLTDREKTKIAKQILTGELSVSDTGVDKSDIVLGIN